MEKHKGKIAFLAMLLVIDWALFNSKYRKAIQEKIDTLGSKVMDKLLGDS